MTFVWSFLVLISLIVCFSGRTLFATTRFFGGFLIGGLVGFEAGLMFIRLPANIPFYVVPLASFIIAGLIGGLLSMWLYAVLLLLSGIGLGSFIGLLVGYVISLGGDPYNLTQSFFAFRPNNTVQLFAMLVAAVLLGALSLSYQEGMTMFSTAFFGAGVATINLVDLISVSTTITFVQNNVFVIFFWVFLGIFGLYVQNSAQVID